MKLNLAPDGSLCCPICGEAQVDLVNIELYANSHYTVQANGWVDRDEDFTGVPEWMLKDRADPLVLTFECGKYHEFTFAFYRDKGRVLTAIGGQSTFRSWGPE
ncbi:MAG: hypothetical protein RL661_894 [Pseudomonadota bacterium]|jgi:hypothetical protein